MDPTDDDAAPDTAGLAAAYLLAARPGGDPAAVWAAFQEMRAADGPKKAPKQLRRAGLLRLPAEMLDKIASHTVAPALVVAVGKNLEARTALRKGTDAAERARFGGVGLTVREAGAKLSEYGARASALASRADAGRTLGIIVAIAAKRGYWINFAQGTAGEFKRDGFDLISAMIAYGADLDARHFQYICSPLHFVARCFDAGPGSGNAIKLIRRLLAAGHDIDMVDRNGVTPLCWCLTTMPATDAHYELATFLIEQGCDVLKAHLGYFDRDARGENDLDNGDFIDPLPPTLVDVIHQQPYTQANQRFMDYFRGKLASARSRSLNTAVGEL